MSNPVLLGASTFVEVLVILFIFIPLMLIWIFALVDLFGRRDLGGGAKVLWLFVIVLLPLLGVLIYYLTRPTLVEEEVGAAERERERRR